MMLSPGGSMIFPKLDTDLNRIKIPSCVQPKYDGECAIWTGEKLVNRFGRERWLPFCKTLPKDLKLVGELYWADGKRNFYDALSHLKTDDPLLKFAIFALYEVDMPFVEQMKLLNLVINNTDQVKVVYGQNCYSHLEVEHIMDLNISNGWEGSVIKPLMGKKPEEWIKHKPDETMDLLIMGISKKHSAIAVGKDGKIIGHCSLIGKGEVADVIAKQTICGETKEDYLIAPEIVVEVKHLGVIEPSGSLRSPRIARLRYDLRKEDI
jgi:ATP-dependent DNA ligase